MDTKRPYEVIRREEVSVGRFTIVCDEIHINGKRYPFSYERGKDCVVVLPILGDSVVLIRQYRHSLNDWFWEVPAGGVEEGEAPETAAEKELMEEAGCKADELVKIGSYPVSLGTSGAWSHIYVARCKSVGEQHTEGAEIIEVSVKSIVEFERMIAEGEFLHMAGIIAWERYKSRFEGRIRTV